MPTKRLKAAYEQQLEQQHLGAQRAEEAKKLQQQQESLHQQRLREQLLRQQQLQERELQLQRQAEQGEKLYKNHLRFSSHEFVVLWVLCCQLCSVPLLRADFQGVLLANSLKSWRFIPWNHNPCSLPDPYPSDFSYRDTQHKVSVAAQESLFYQACFRKGDVRKYQIIGHETGACSGSCWERQSCRWGVCLLKQKTHFWNWNDAWLFMFSANRLIMITWTRTSYKGRKSKVFRKRKEVREFLSLPSHRLPVYCLAWETLIFISYPDWIQVKHKLAI